MDVQRREDQLLDKISELVTERDAARAEVALLSSRFLDVDVQFSEVSGGA